MDHRRAINGSRVGFTRGHFNVAVHPSQDQIAGGLQSPVGCPDRSLGVETYQCVIRQVGQPMTKEFSILIDSGRHSSSRIDAEIERGLSEVVVVQFDSTVYP